MWERIIISLSYFCEKFRRLRARPANLCRQSAPTSRKPATTTAPCARTHSPPRSRATRTPPRACARRGMCLTATSVAFARILVQGRFQFAADVHNMRSKLIWSCGRHRTTGLYLQRWNSSAGSNHWHWHSGLSNVHSRMFQERNSESAPNHEFYLHHTQSADE
jgi:hypothetical protein